MVAPQPTAPSGNQPPPDLPNLEKTENNLVNYLRTFSLWCRQGFAAKLDAKTALPGVMLQTNDTPPGVTPKVYLIGVNSTPNLTLSQMKLGDDSGGGGPIIAGSNTFLPLVGGTLSGPLTAPYLNLDAVGVERAVSYKAGGVTQFYTGVNNTGATWFVAYCDNSGVYVGSAVAITRSTGAVAFNTPVTIVNNLAINSVPLTVYQQAGTIAQAGGGSAMIQGAGSGSQVFWTFHMPGVFACNFGMDASGYFYSGGWSFGANAYRFWTTRDFASPPCDYRIKEGDKPLPSTWDRVKALKPISYRVKGIDRPGTRRTPTPLKVDPDDREHWGFVAHELQETLLQTAATGVKDDPALIQSPTLLPLVAALTKTIQEMQARIETLEAR